jgi:membrane-associated protease RseP (regulator of RpoE activity)
MKRFLIALLVLVIMGSTLLFAQEEVEDIDAIIEEVMEEIEFELDSGDKTIIINKYEEYDPNAPKMGVFLADMDFKDIYELHYDYNYGVYLTGVTTGGPSAIAGLMEGDIIMEFNGEKVRFEEHLVRMIRSNKIGDEIQIKFFRDETIYETTLVLDTLDKKSDDLTITPGLKKKRMIDVGHGGGGWMPVWFMPDVVDLNTMLHNLDFKEETFSEDGFLLQGGGGKGTVGKGWFLGGMGAGYKNKETTKYDWTHFMNGEEVTSTVARKVTYDIGYGGVTLDKRLGLSKNIITSLGFMIGWGSNLVKISQSDNNGELPNFNFDDPSENMDQFYDYKSKLRLEQEFILFQPKAMLMIRILDWLSLRSEVGYMLSHSTDGWKAKWNGEKVKLENAPDSTLDGLTITIGPWFGF